MMQYLYQEGPIKEHTLYGQKVALESPNRCGIIKTFSIYQVQMVLAAIN